ncbi:MAG: ABC transporter permease [Thermoplasmata archaeon]|nr:ABC transporter permease [Thermoplasmata archaeon]
MASPLMKIIKKEVLEMIRDPRLLLGMIIVPVLIFPLMGTAMSMSASTVEDSVSHIDLGIVNLDSGNRSGELIGFLILRGVNDTYPSAGEMGNIMNGTESDTDLLMVIPSDFTAKIEANGSANITLYTPMNTYSLSESLPADVVTSYLQEYQEILLNERLAESYPGSDISEVRNPVAISSLSVIEGEPVTHTPSEITNQMMTQSLMIPMVLMILLIMVAQLAATSVAMEKEEKTLETLLTTPVSRGTILFGKIAGVVVISAIAVVAYMAGFSYYISSMNSMASGTTSLDLAALGLVPSTTGMLVLLATLFFSLVSALSLSVLVASFTEDVRSAQSLLGVIYVPIFIPALVLMFVDLSQLPALAQAAIMAIPFSYPVLAAKAMYTGEFTVILFGIVYQIVFTAIVIYIASRMFSSEKLLTARFNLKKRKPLSLGRIGRKN